MTKRNILYASAATRRGLYYQVSKLFDYVERHNQKNYLIFEDLTGKDGKHGLEIIVRQAHRIDTVFVTDLSVLSTDLKSLCYVYSKLNQAGTKIVLVTSAISYSKPVTVDFGSVPLHDSIKLFNFDETSNHGFLK